MPLRAFDISKIPPPPDEVKKQVVEFLKKPHKKLNVEIGCGVGFHPIQFALSHADEGLLAIERTSEKFKKFKGRMLNHNLPNLMGVHAEAAILLPHTLTPSCVDKFFILYPNPYPKESQKYLRWAHSSFLNFVIDSLKPGGELMFATNLSAYKDELIQRLPELFQFESVDVTEVTSSPKPITHFEKKYLADGQTCFHIRFKLSS